MLVDPDLWLQHVDGQMYVRRLSANGTFRLNHQAYYVKKQLRGQHVNVKIDASNRQLVVYYQGSPLKQLPFTGYTAG